MTELIAVITSFLDRYGLPLVLLGAVLYGLYKWIIPLIIEAYKKQQEYFFSEIQRLNKESREDRATLLEAFHQNTKAFQELRSTMDEMRKDLNAVKEEVTHVKEDVSDVYKIVARGKGIINGGDYYKKDE